MRQYIGARYVPKFMGTYDATQIYEALCVVDNGMGTSYISKIPTPAGTPLTDTAYWALYGASSGAIVNLQNQIDNINNNVIPPITSDIATIKAQIPLAAKNTAANTHILIIADSYGDEATEFPMLIKNMNIFKEVDIVAGGGWGFTGKDGAGSGTTGPTLEWKTHLTNFVGAHTADELADIDKVYIIGGFNDHYATASGTVETYMSAFFTYAKANLPNASFHLGLCAWAGQGTVATPNETQSGSYERSRILNIVMPAYQNAPAYGCEYIGHFIDCLHNYSTDFDSTLYHPSATAQTKIAIKLINYILGSSVRIGNSEAGAWILNGNAGNVLNFRIFDDSIQVYAAYAGQVTIDSNSTYSAPYYITTLTTSSCHGAGSSNCIAGRYGSNKITLPIILRNGTQQTRELAWFQIDQSENINIISTTELHASDVCTFFVLDKTFSLFET